MNNVMSRIMTRSPKMSIHQSLLQCYFTWQRHFGDMVTVIDLDMGDCLRLSGCAQSNHKSLKIEHFSSLQSEWWYDEIRIRKMCLPFLVLNLEEGGHETRMWVASQAGNGHQFIASMKMRTSSYKLKEQIISLTQKIRKTFSPRSYRKEYSPVNIMILAQRSMLDFWPIILVILYSSNRKLIPTEERCRTFQNKSCYISNIRIKNTY